MPHLCKIQTLKKRSEFLSVSATRKRWVTPAFIVQASSGQDSNDICGYGLIASKKMIGNAVKRNRAKRRLRALICEILPSLTVAGYNFVFIAKPDILIRDYKMLGKDLRWALKRLKDRL